MSDASINYQEAFNHLQYHADHMNLWEQGFVDSLEHQFKQKGRLSISQERHLFKLTDKYNMDKIREAQQWEKNYGPEQLIDMVDVESCLQKIIRTVKS